MTLKDQQIRMALIAKLKNASLPPKAIIEELRVHNGNAIADVVALYSEAHCYEIKGETDKIARVSRQSRFYDFSFRKITLVTTQNHQINAEKYSPAHWGIIIAHHNTDSIKFKHYRKARNNPKFNKELALMTLWKSEMLSLLEEDSFSRKSRSFLANMISMAKKKEELSTAICEQLISRPFRDLV